jgi:5'-nucleotidase
MQLRVQGWNAQVAPIAAVRVGTNAHTLMRNRGGESTVGNLVADAIRAAAGTDIAMQNSGGLRADLQEGEITRGSIYEVMPFDNQVFTMGLTGREVRLALEEALKSGRATQVSGIRYTFDPDRAAMDRVVSLTDAKGAALDTAKVYRVAVNDFMATGGDNYDVLAGGLDRTNTQILVRDALEKYIAERSANGPLEYAGDGRVQRVDGKPAPPNNPNAGAPANATPTTPSPTPPK